MLRHGLEILQDRIAAGPITWHCVKLVHVPNQSVSQSINQSINQSKQFGLFGLDLFDSRAQLFREH